MGTTRSTTADHDSLRELRATEAALLHAAAVHVARARDAAAALAAMGSTEEAEEAAAVPRRSVMDAEEALCCVITNGIEVWVVIMAAHGCCTHTERWFATRSLFSTAVAVVACAVSFWLQTRALFGPFMFLRLGGSNAQ